MTFKECGVCHKTLSIESFSLLSSGYYHTYCKTCDALLAKKRRRENPLKAMITRCKSRAKQRDIEFNLEESDLILPTHCPILGIPLSVNGYKLKDNSYSVDRIDPTKGYIKGNVQIISQRANRIKTDASIEELEKVLTFMKNYGL